MASTLTLGEAISVPAVFISAAAAASCLFSESFCLFGFNVRVRLRQLAFHGIRPSSLVPASGNQLRAETAIGGGGRSRPSRARGTWLWLCPIDATN